MQMSHIVRSTKEVSKFTRTVRNDEEDSIPLLMLVQIYK